MNKVIIPVILVIGIVSILGIRDIIGLTKPDCRSECTKLNPRGKCDLYFDITSIDITNHAKGLDIKFKYRADNEQNGAAGVKITAIAPEELAIKEAYLIHSETSSTTQDTIQCVVCDNKIVCTPRLGLNQQAHAQDDNHYEVRIEATRDVVYMEDCTLRISSCTGNDDVDQTNNDYQLEIPCSRFWANIPPEEEPERLPRDIPDICKELGIIEDCFGGVNPWGKSQHYMFLDYKDNLENISEIEILVNNEVLQRTRINRNNTILPVLLNPEIFSNISFRYIKRENID